MCNECSIDSISRNEKEHIVVGFIFSGKVQRFMEKAESDNVWRGPQTMHEWSAGESDALCSRLESRLRELLQGRGMSRWFSV